MSELDSLPPINYRAAMYFVGCTIIDCPRCRATTMVVCLVLPRGHQLLDMDDVDDLDEVDDFDALGRGLARPATSSVAERCALLFHIEWISDSVQRRLCDMAPGYRQGANHCTWCDTALDDQDLFCELDGAFLPSTAAAATAITLIAVDEPIAVAAAGYSFDPPFFASMSLA